MNLTATGYFGDESCDLPENYTGEPGCTVKLLVKVQGCEWSVQAIPLPKRSGKVLPCASFTIEGTGNNANDAKNEAEMCLEMARVIAQRRAYGALHATR